MHRLAFTKGHGTKNDFVVFADPDGAFDPTPAQVAYLCDRRAGVGGDGILRAVRGRHIAAWAGDPDLWFMDYRNADGSIAEMCGNGVRVFLLFLKISGLVASDTQTIEIGTRAGLRVGTYLPDGTVRVWLGQPKRGASVEVSADGQAWPAASVDVGNPHAVSIVTDADLAALDLAKKPDAHPATAFPQGANFEFVTHDGDEITMRVYERGVGETFSCGTGTVAATCAVASEQGRRNGTWRVRVPGGVVSVELDGPDAYLTGPAELVYTGTIDVPDAKDLA